jgi:hypothetical protein
MGSMGQLGAIPRRRQPIFSDGAVPRFVYAVDICPRACAVPAEVRNARVRIDRGGPVDRSTCHRQGRTALANAGRASPHDHGVTMSQRSRWLSLEVPRVCVITAVYQLAWGLAMLIRGAEFLRPGLGDYACLSDPLAGTWIRLVGTTLNGMCLVNLALSRVTDPAAQRWIRLGSLAFWLNELVIDGGLLQLPAFLHGAKHITLVGIVVTGLGRGTMAVLWLRARPQAALP